MNSAIAVRTTTAPIVIRSVLELLRPPPPEVELVAVRTVGVDVVGVVTGDSGTPGENGLLVVVWAPAADGSTPTPRTASSSQIPRVRGASTAMGRLLVTAPTRFRSRRASALGRQRLLHGRRLGRVAVWLLVVRMLLVVNALHVD